MPKVRVRTTQKASWSSESLNKAVQLIEQGYSIRKAAKTMNIPFLSLQKRSRNILSQDDLGRHTVFSPDEEAELASMVKKNCQYFLWLHWQSNKKSSI